MSCEDTTALIDGPAQGADLARADEQRLDAHLATCAACRAEAETMTATWSSLGTFDDEQVPHERLRARFHAGLAAYEARESHHWTERFFERWWPQQPALQVGLAAALALVGVLIGQQLPSPVDAEVAALRAEVRTVGLALLDHQSASERLLGVAWSRRTAQTPEVVERAARARAIRPELERAARCRRRTARGARSAGRHRRARARAGRGRSRR